MDEIYQDGLPILLEIYRKAILPVHQAIEEKTGCKIGAESHAATWHSVANYFSCSWEILFADKLIGYLILKFGFRWSVEIKESKHRYLFADFDNWLESRIGKGLSLPKKLGCYENEMGETLFSIDSPLFDEILSLSPQDRKKIAADLVILPRGNAWTKTIQDCWIDKEFTEEQVKRTLENYGCMTLPKRTFPTTDDTTFFYLSPYRYNHTQEQALQKEVLEVIDNFLAQGIVPCVGDQIRVYVEPYANEYISTTFVVLERYFRSGNIIDFWLEEVGKKVVKET